MKKTYVLDATSLEADPNIVDLLFTPGSHTPAHESATGKAIYNVLTSRLGVAVLMGAVIAAPSRPPVIATEPFVALLAGDAAFTDEMKKYTGRVVRQIIEHLGGAFVRRGVKVTVSSRYGSGSIYTFQGGPALALSPSVRPAELSA
jgi:hypothetical protein